MFDIIKNKFTADGYKTYFILIQKTGNILLELTRICVVSRSGISSNSVDGTALAFGMTHSEFG